MSAYRSRTVPAILIEPRGAVYPGKTPREYIIRQHPDACMVGCVQIIPPQALREEWQEVEAPEPTDMELVLEAADSYCEEYGGRKLRQAILRIRAAQT